MFMLNKISESESESVVNNIVARWSHIVVLDI